MGRLYTSKLLNMKSDCKRHVIRYEQWDAKSPFKYYPSPISLLRDIPESISNAEDLDLNKPKSFFAAFNRSDCLAPSWCVGIEYPFCVLLGTHSCLALGVHPIVRIMFIMLNCGVSKVTKGSPTVSPAPPPSRSTQCTMISRTAIVCPDLESFTEASRDHGPSPLGISHTHIAMKHRMRPFAHPLYPSVFHGV